MAESKNLMTQGSIAKKMLMFAFPVFLGNLFQQMYNTADSLIVGNFLGSNALAAVSSAGNIIFLLIGFLSGLAMGAGVIIARYFGARDKENLERAVHTTVAFGLVAGVLLTIVGLFLTPYLLVWTKTPDAVMAESSAYFRVYFLGSMGAVMYNVCVGILQAVGDSRHPLYYLIISSVINVVLDIMFIAVFHSGVEGAALATAISQFISALLCMIQLVRTKDEYRIVLRRIRFDGEMLKKIIEYGLPSGIQNSIIALANVVVQSHINSFGELAMAGCGAFSKIEGFAFLPITSFNMALTTFVGQNLGAREYDRVKKGSHFGIICAMVLAELIGVVVFLAGPYLISAFDSSPEVIAIGTERAKASALFFFLLAYSHAIAAILRGAGKAVVPMLTMMACWCVIRVAFLSIMIPLTHNIAAVYWVYPLTWALSSIVFFVYDIKSHWLQKAKEADEVEELTSWKKSEN